MYLFYWQWGIRLLMLLTCFGGVGMQTSVASDDTNFVTKLLATNRPWLNPTLVRGTYSLDRRPDGESDQVLGPYSFSDQDTSSYGTPHRIGSILLTPLHVMTAKSISYTWKLSGNTKWNHKDVTILDVEFASYFSEAAGFGGQGNVRYSFGNWSIKQVRMLIDTNSFVPVVIGTASDDSTNSVARVDFAFDPLFYDVEEGKAPRSIDCNIGNLILEHQEFQVIKGVWMFKDGDAWFNEYSYGYFGHIQGFEMTNVTVRAALKVNLERTGNGARIVLPTSNTGLSIQTATNLNGPWIEVSKSALENGNQLNISTKKDQQFYRFAQ